MTWSYDASAFKMDGVDLWRRFTTANNDLPDNLAMQFEIWEQPPQYQTIQLRLPPTDMGAESSFSIYTIPVPWVQWITSQRNHGYGAEPPLLLSMGFSSGPLRATDHRIVRRVPLPNAYDNWPCVGSEAAVAFEALTPSDTCLAISNFWGRTFNKDGLVQVTRNPFATQMTGMTTPLIFDYDALTMTLLKMLEEWEHLSIEDILKADFGVARTPEQLIKIAYRLAQPPPNSLLEVPVEYSSLEFL